MDPASQFSFLRDLPTVVHSSYVGMQNYCPVSHYNKPLRINKTATATSATSSNLSSAEPADSIVCCVSIRDLIYQDFKEASIDSLLKLPQNTKLLFSVRDLRSVMCDANNDSVLFDGAGGRKRIDVKAYADRIKLDRPGAVIALADEVPWALTSRRPASATSDIATATADVSVASASADSSSEPSSQSCVTSNKRLSKSSQRNATWFQALRARNDIDWSKTFLFGVTCSSTSLKVIVDSATALIGMGANGLVIGGANLGESTSDLLTVVAAVRQAVGKDVIILVQGCSTPYLSAKCIISGATMIQSNYPKILTDMGYSANWGSIMDLLNNSSNSNNSNSESSINSGSDGTESPLKRRKIDNITDSSDFTVINLWDSKYSRSKEPLMSSCSCYSCKAHSRAYIHHLLIAHELLGEILLYRHNLHQFTILMETFGELHRNGGDSAKNALEAVINALR